MTKGGKFKNHMDDQNRSMVEKMRTHFIQFPFWVKWQTRLKNDMLFSITNGPAVNIEVFSRDVNNQMKNIEFLQFLELSYGIYLALQHKRIRYCLYGDFGLLHIIGSENRNIAYGVSVGYHLPSKKSARNTSTKED